MGQNEDHIGPEDEDPSRTLDGGQPLYELGSYVGGYKLLSVLGEGGFGIVYLAEQQYPIKRLVALKLIKPGMDTKQVIARFETERQALAMLDHPHIAQVFDAGATKVGRPYFAMEYVKGIPITEYCDKYKLDTPERLRLFIPLCQAIQHAHHKGIIHRDIKPSNALVTLHDEKPIPKIIDFGVAKALNQRLTERTLFTAKGEFIGTPEYMSPEQAELTGLDVDTRTDIYSLGVLLYELLTGCTPFDPGELRSKGYAQMQRIICEQDPVRPSTKLTTLGGRLEDIARRRSATAVQLRKAVRGDLDWIVMKALEKDRARRYGTAQALAEDVERHLNHQPVSAGSPGVLYRARKFVRRHRTQVMVGGCLLAVVILAAVIVGQQQRARQNLRAEQKKSEARQEALALETARSSLSAAQADYASGQYVEASKALQILAGNKYVGAQARLLRARMALDRADADPPIAELEALTEEPNEIAAQAHLLLARIYADSRVEDDKTARDSERRANEHLQKAKSLASDQAEAYFSSALLADTPGERLELLDKALRINPGHVDSLRVRAMVHHASRNYDDMLMDASTIVGKNPPEGYELRAIALREKAQLLGQKELRNEMLSRAVADHSRAIELASAQARFYDERCETYMRLGDYEKALADARECIKLSPEEGLYHFHAFCALTALGQYAEAQGLAEAVQSSSSAGADQFRRWLTGYAHDVVDRQSPWHPAGPEPEGTPFTIIQETLKAHQSLALKARCAVREGLIATWSPAGDELAYGRGALGYSAIEVLNLKTGTTRLLSYSGFDPAWSPDGRRIAYVRHRRILRLQDLEGKKTYVPGQEDREVWIMNADRTGKPRMLARGGYPSWSGDSKRVYYYSPEEGGYLCCVSVEGDKGSQVRNDALGDPNPRPTRVIRSLGPFPVVSPDEKHVVWHINDVAELAELPSGKVVARWIGFFPNWSPDSKSLVFSRFDGRHDGVWVCDVEKGKAARVIDDWMCFRCAWTPNGGQIALSPALTIRGTWGYTYAGMLGSIWVGPLDYSIFGADSSAVVQDWPRDESDARSLAHMLQGYEAVPERTTEAEPLRRRLIEVLQQAAASADANALQPVEQLADAYLWFGQYDDAERLYLQTRAKLLAKSGATARGFLDLTEEAVRFYLDARNRGDQAEPLCQELWESRRKVPGADSPTTLRTALLLARIYERQKRYGEAERLYLKVLNAKPREDPEEKTPAVYESVLSPFLNAPLNYLLDEAAFAVRLLENQGAGSAPDRRWRICAHYLLARLYTTCPVAELHNVTKAIEHGETACELSGGAEPLCLDALAAACAEAGQLELAVQRQREALARLSGTKAWMAPVFANRLTRYERGMTKRPAGLVARWEFEESKDGTVPDTSGNNLHGRLAGEAGLYTDPERGHVLRLDGEGDWVDCGADERFDLTDTITISVWIKVDRFDKTWQTIVAKGDGAWRLQRDRATDDLQFACGGVGATRARPASSPASPRDHTDVNDGKWHHVAGVYDGRSLNLYLDGALDTIVPALAFTRLATSKDHVLIGRNVGAAGPCEWNGLIDDLRIYSYALSPQDIKALHEGQEPSSDQGATR
jgi:serine/threonine protein kinase